MEQNKELSTKKQCDIHGISSSINALFAKFDNGFE